jgi:lysophospholipid acyltransferase (LPLAT)-like uncharacterized protein
VYLTSTKHISNKNNLDKLIKNNENIIFVFWHGRLYLLTIFITRLKTQIHSVTSGHKDGNIVAGVISMLGSKVIRGSSSQGATKVIRQSLKALKEKDNCLSIVPDGPRGPRMRISSEFVAIAQKTGSHIVPITFSCKKAKIFKSWDRFMLPTIFNDITFEYGSTYKPGEKDDKTEIQKKIEDEMNEITWRLDAKYDHNKIDQG